MKQLITNVGYSLGLNITKHTNESDIIELIKKLKPLDCGKDLIRIGGNADGGYLIPNDLEGIEYCFSPGVNTVSDFENHLASLNIRSFLADYSVDSPPTKNDKFTFDKRFLGADDTETFFTLKSWKDKYLNNYKGDLLLQMDIEGFEYEVIFNTPMDELNKFRIMVIEFHYLDRLFDKFAFSFVFKRCFEKILKGFHVAHIHPNNSGGCCKLGSIEVPRLLELTFYNKNRVFDTKNTDCVFPHPLDRDNVTNKKTLYLPKCWYS